jgi:hypothetical protein
VENSHHSDPQRIIWQLTPHVGAPVVIQVTGFIITGDIASFMIEPPILRFPQMGVPLNHPFIDGFSLINHIFRGTPIYGTPHILLLGRMDGSGRTEPPPDLSR